VVMEERIRRVNGKSMRRRRGRCIPEMDWWGREGVRVHSFAVLVHIKLLHYRCMGGPACYFQYRGDDGLLV
jgi:hypothetical protein